jgi:hypothetical protein
MATLRSTRRSFNPEALSQIAVIVDDVWKELAAESAFSPSLSSGPPRSFVARKVFQLAQAQWNATQIKELLLRAVHNEMSILRRSDTRDPYENLGGRAVHSSSSVLISIFP